MNISDLLQSITTTQWQALIALVVLIVLSALLYLVWKQNQKIQALEYRQQQVGFLGKQLVPVALVAVAAVGVVGAVSFSRSLNSPANGGVSVSDEQSQTFRVQTSKTYLPDGKVQAAFLFVPQISGVAWAGDRQDLTYDVYWDITAPSGERTYKIELNLTRTKPGGFVLTTAPGKYKISLDIYRGDKSWKHQEEVTL